MAVLTNAQRRAIWAEVMQELSTEGAPVSLTKPELRLVINAIDGWLDDNAAGLNAAINAAGGSSLTVKQKVRLSAKVLLDRYRSA